MTKVLVVAPSAVARAGLSAVVQTYPRLTVAGQTGALADVAGSVDELHPEVILMDAAFGGDELSVFPFHALPPTVVMTDDAGMALIKAGARAVLPPSATAAEIGAAIDAVAAGLIVLHPEALDQPALTSSDAALTAREVQVLRMLAEGLANKEIAYRLGLSEHTVKFHVSALFGKLHASSRTEAVTAGIRQGLIML